MYTHTIENLAAKRAEIKEKFRGVFSSNTLPEKNLEGYYIANLDRDTESGSHWIAIEITPSGQKNLYFDSYGFPPCRDSFTHFMNENYTCNRKRLQHLLSTTCGQWCLYFLYRRSENWKMNEITEALHDQGETHCRTIVNDHVVNYFVEDVFDTDLSVIDRKYVHDQIARQMIENLS